MTSPINDRATSGAACAELRYRISQAKAEDRPRLEKILASLEAEYERLVAIEDALRGIA